MDLRCQKLKCSMLHVNSCVQSSEANLPYSVPSDSGTSIKLPCACAWLQMLYVTCVTHTGAKGMAVGARCQLFKPCSQCFSVNGASHSIRNKRTWTCSEHCKQGSVLHLTSPVTSCSLPKQSYVVVELKCLIQSLHQLVCCGFLA